MAWHELGTTMPAHEPKGSLVLATWNVLHRVHAENWSEDLARFPDERARERAVAELVASELAAGVEAIGLQECSGDTLAVLAATLGRTVALFDFELPRRPRLRVPQRGALLARGSEHLVIVADARLGARMLGGAAFPSDPGKGWVAADLGPMALVATHVTFGARAGAQLAALHARARGYRKPVALVGDFNADRAFVAAALGDGFALAALDPALATRPRSAGEKSQAIDHIALAGATPSEAQVVDARGASDHQLVRARATFAMCDPA